jgi:hypothetical protein
LRLKDKEDFKTKSKKTQNQDENKLFIIIALLSTAVLFAQITEPQVDAFVKNTQLLLMFWNVAIVKDGSSCKGYGVKSIDTQEKVDANTFI